MILFYQASASLVHLMKRKWQLEMTSSLLVCNTATGPINDKRFQNPLIIAFFCCCGEDRIWEMYLAGLCWKMILPNQEIKLFRWKISAASNNILTISQIYYLVHAIYIWKNDRTSDFYALKASFHAKFINKPSYYLITIYSYWWDSPWRYLTKATFCRHSWWTESRRLADLVIILANTSYLRITIASINCQDQK